MDAGLQVSPGQIVAAVLAFLASAWPGYRLATLLDDEERFSLVERASLGVLLLFGVFGLLEAPLLLAHASTDTALLVFGVGYVVSLAAVELSLRRRRRAAPLELPAQAEMPARRAALLLGLSLVASLVGAALFARQLLPRSLGAAACLALLAANVWFAVRATGFEGSHTPPGFARVARWAKIACALLIAAGAVAAVLWVREDADDTLYLSEALALRDTPAMGAYAPAHRGENLPPVTLYSFQNFELLAACLSRISGLHTLALLRTVFAPLPFLLSLALYYGILKSVVPRPLLGIALLFVVAYLSFGASSHYTVNNYLLTRPQQGKTWLMHVAMPGLTLVGLSFLRAPRVRLSCTLLLVSVAALGFAPSAVLLVPTHLGLLSLAHFSLARSRAAFRAAALLLLAALPQVVFAAYVALEAEAIREYISGAEPIRSRWRDMLLFQHFGLDRQGGALEVFCLVACPLVLGFAARREAKLYPAVYTLFLFVTVLNPLAFHPLADFATEEGVQRFLWLLPLPVIFGALGAALAAVLARLFGSTAAGAGVLGLLGAMPLLGGRPVFSQHNWYFDEPQTDEIRRAENAYKVPAALLAFARTLSQSPLGPDQRVLCSERAASHLAPLVPAMNFVYTRGYQSLTPLAMVGRADEAESRRKLAREFLATGSLPLDGGTQAADAAGIERSLRAAKVAYVITEAGNDPTATKRLASSLRAAGFEQVQTHGRYALYRDRRKTQR